MNVKVYVYEKGKANELIKGNYSYCEGKSRQEGKPSFFISVDGEEDFEINFSSETKEEIQEFIDDLKEILNNMK